MANITIGCRLPTGIILNLYKPFPAEIVEAARNGTLKNAPSPELLGSVELHGQNQRWKALGMLDKAVLRDEDYGVTEIDKSFWDAWVEQNKDFPALKNSAIFVAKVAADAEVIAKELSTAKEKKTGLAGMDKEVAGISSVSK